MSQYDNLDPNAKDFVKQTNEFFYSIVNDFKDKIYNETGLSIKVNYELFFSVEELKEVSSLPRYENTGFDRNWWEREMDKYDI